MSVSVPPRLSSLGRMNTLASWAEPFAQALLQESFPRRWAHVQGVAARARSLASVLGADADLLEAAAWLHDIGYASGPAATGLHSLDGARYPA
jgi:HD superfamily phosphodiesterase